MLAVAFVLVKTAGARPEVYLLPSGAGDRFLFAKETNVSAVLSCPCLRSGRVVSCPAANAVIKPGKSCAGPDWALLAWSGAARSG